MDIQFEEAKFEISKQGAVKIEYGYIIRKGDGFVALELETSPKHARLWGTGSDDEDGIPIIQVALNVEEGEDPNITEIRFPEYPGYNAWSVTISRYTTYVCLLKYPQM